MKIEIFYNLSIFFVGHCVAQLISSVSDDFGGFRKGAAHVEVSKTFCRGVAPEELNFVVKGSSQKAEWLSRGIQAVVSALSDCFLRLEDLIDVPSHLLM